MKSQHDVLLGHPLLHQRLGQNQVRPIGLDPDLVALEVKVHEHQEVKAHTTNEILAIPSDEGLPCF